jgi:chromosome segregation ATPase
MAKFNTIIETKVLVDGSEAINKLGKLEAQAKDFRASLKDIKKESDEFKALSKTVASLDRELQKTTLQIDKNQIALELNGRELVEAKLKLQELNAAEQKNEAQIKKTNQAIQACIIEHERLSKQNRILDETYTKTNETLEATKKKLKETTQYTAAYTAANEKLKQTTDDLQALRQEYGLTGMTMRQLRTYQAELNREIDNVTFGTQAYKELKAKIQDVSQTINNQRNDLRDTRTGWQKFKDEIRGFGVATMGNIGGEIAIRAFDGMTQALLGTVTQAAKLSDELADIARLTGFTAEETLKLNQQLSQIQTRTGTGDLREIVMVF